MRSTIESVIVYAVSCNIVLILLLFFFLILTVADKREQEAFIGKEKHFRNPTFVNMCNESGVDSTTNI